MGLTGLGAQVPIFLVVAASFADVASAGQVAPPPQQAQPAKARVDGLSDIVVTARRYSERLQDVPIAVTALSGAQLNERNITRTEDLVRVAPGLVIQPSSYGRGSDAFGIRSQRQLLVSITVDQSVGVYQDEVYQSRPLGLNSSLFDLSSAQVLKGPQGTLFGRNTSGGAVVFTSQAPSDVLAGHASVTIANYDTVRGEAALNLPLSDKLQVRLAGVFSKHDGYSRNLAGPRLDDEDSRAFRVSVKYEPLPSVRNLLIVSGMREIDNGTGFKQVQLQPAYEAYFQSRGLMTFGRGAASGVLQALDSQPFHTVSSNPVQPGINQKTVNAVDNLQIDVSDTATIKNIAAYRYVRSITNADFDGLPLSIFVSQDAQKTRQYSDELQIVQKAGNLDLIGGLFYFREEGREQTLTNGRPSGGPARNTSYAAFAQGTWRPSFLDGLSLTAGARITRDIRFFEAQNRNPNGTCRIPINDAAPTITISPCSYPQTIKFAEPTWTFSADYRFDPNLLVYGTYRRGYRSGGFSITGTRRAELAPFRPEFVDDYEIGLKSNFTVAGGPTRINAAFYYDDYRGIQRAVAEIRQELGVTFPVSVTRNAASATIKGFEVDATWRPVPILELTAFWNYSRPRYKSFPVNSSIGPVDYSGNPFSFAPRNTVGAEITLNVPPLDAGGKFEVRGNLYYQAVTYSQDVVYDPTQLAGGNTTTAAVLQNTPLGRLAAYTVVNGSAGWRGLYNGRLDLSLYVRNLTDKNYATGGADFTTSFGTNTLVLGAPRTYGVEVGVNF